MQDNLKFVPMPKYMMRKNALSKLLASSNCAGKNLLEIGYGGGDIFLVHKIRY